MKRLNKNYDVSKVVMALSTNIASPYIGAIVKFKNLENRGTYHKENIFEIGGAQRVWGYDENDKYTMIDGFRLFSITSKDDFGTPANLYELEILSMPN
jgi:hypothetical protein